MKMKRLLIRFLPSVLLVLVVMAALILLQARINHLPGTEKETGKSFRYHFAMVVDNDGTPFWKLVYEGAQQRAAQQDAYVELIGVNLNEYYSVDDQLQMAAYSGVDGIFVVPDGGQDTNRCIGEIVQSRKNPIPVLTMMENDSNSGRSGYVGINNYEQGLAYGRLIVELAAQKEVRNVTLLASAARDEDRCDSFWKKRLAMNARLKQPRQGAEPWS